MHQIQVQVYLWSVCLLHLFCGQAVIREISAHHVLFRVIRLWCRLREHTKFAAAHPRGDLPCRLLQPLCLLGGGIFPGDHDHQIIPARRVLHYLLVDRALLLQVLSRCLMLLLVPICYPCPVDGEMMQIFVLLRDQQLPPVIGMVSLLRSVESGFRD